MSDVSDDDLLPALWEIAERGEKDRLAKEYVEWCRVLEAIPSDMKQTSKDGLKADIELQPKKWMSEGKDILLSRTGHVQTRHFNGRSEPLNPYLVYPVFQMGAEVFLKGMWLCQFEECRLMRYNTYICKNKRDEYDGRLCKLGHDLFKIIDAIRRIEKYQKDEVSLKFLRVVEGIIREFYYPLYEAEVSRWTSSRYPKRFYNDLEGIGKMDSINRYPPHEIVKKLFEEMESHADQLWGITRILIGSSILNGEDGKTIP